MSGPAFGHGHGRVPLRRGDKHPGQVMQPPLALGTLATSSTAHPAPP